MFNLFVFLNWKAANSASSDQWFLRSLQNMIAAKSEGISSLSAQSPNVVRFTPAVGQQHAPIMDTQLVRQRDGKKQSCQIKLFEDELVYWF